ncbi:MAG: phosphoesterase pA-phosphatase-like protein [Proteobacteria bacterium]|nr:phosphoesterase pA-phosphatase-like protein [Pseudomonadota bacterium]
MEPTLLMDWDHAGLDALFTAVTWLGSLAVLLPLALLLWWRRRGERSASFVALALIGASALGHLVKLIAARPRPDLYPPLVPMPEDWSFPSAHAVQVTAFALAWLLRPGTSPGRIEIVVFLAAAALVGVSRPYLQVHFPSDVIAGAILAALWVLLLRRLPEWREHKQ